MNNGTLKINVTKKDIVWNTISSLFFSLVSMVISLIVINIIGTEIGGIFSFGYSTLAYIVFTISYFGIRNFHIVDINYKYSFSDYRSFRIITCIFGFLFCFIYVFILYLNNIYDINKSLILILVSMYGIIEGYFDVYECELQRIGLLYRAGIALFFRTIFFTSTLIVVLLVTKNIYLAVILSLIIKIVVSIYFDIYFYDKTVSKNDKVEIKLFNKNVYNLFIDTLPLFIIIILDLYIYTSSKFFIDINLSNYYNGFYNLLFLPSNIIYLVCSTILRPILTPLSDIYNIDKKDYNMACIKIYKVVYVLSTILFISGLLMSKLYLTIINFLSSEKYLSHIYLENTVKTVYFIIFGGILYSMYAPAFSMNIIENKIKKMLFVYAPVFILSIIISNILVAKYNILGASISFSILMMILTVFIQLIKFKNKKHE